MKKILIVMSNFAKKLAYILSDLIIAKNLYGGVNERRGL